MGLQEIFTVIGQALRAAGQGTDPSVGIVTEKLATVLADKPELLLEVSLSRIYSHWKGREFAILTSWKEYKTEQENVDDLNSLKLKLRGMGFGHIRLLGHGEEEDPEKAGETIDVTEPSLLVVNLLAHPGGSDPDFREKMIGLGQEYDQWSILYHRPETGTEEIATGKTVGGQPATVLTRYKKFVPGAAKYYSQVWQRRGDPAAGTFHLAPGTESKRRVLLVRYADRPHGWIEGMGLESSGDMGFGLYEELGSACAAILNEAAAGQEEEE